MGAGKRKEMEGMSGEGDLERNRGVESGGCRKERRIG